MYQLPYENNTPTRKPPVAEEKVLPNKEDEHPKVCPRLLNIPCVTHHWVSPASRYCAPSVPKNTVPPVNISFSVFSFPVEKYCRLASTATARILAIPAYAANVPSICSFPYGVSTCFAVEFISFARSASSFSE